VGDEPVWSRHETSKAKRTERITDGICRCGAEHPDGTHWRDVASRASVMEVYFIEDPQKIILRALLSFEQRQSGCELISLLRGMLLPNPSCRLLRRGRLHRPHGARQRKLIQPGGELAREHDYDLMPDSHYVPRNLRRASAPSLRIDRK
jgi:hypothetical protein